MPIGTTDNGLLAVIAAGPGSANSGALGRARALAACWAGPVALVLTRPLAEPIPAESLPDAVELVVADEAVARVLDEGAQRGEIRQALERLLGAGGAGPRGGAAAVHVMADDRLLELLPLIADGRDAPPLQLELLPSCAVPETTELWPWTTGVIVSESARLYPLAAATPALPIRQVPPGGGQSAVRALSHLPLLGGQPRLSVVMVIHGGGERVLRSVGSVFEHTPELLELIAVDDGGDDGTRELLAGWAHTETRLRLLTHNRRRGWAASCNRALCRARGDIVVILDGCAVVTPDWSRRLTAHLRSYPRAAAIGPRFNRCRGIQRLPAVGYDTASLEGLDDFARKLARGNDGIAMPVGWLSAACLALSRTALGRVGGFDTRFFPAGFEDDDWCLRLLGCRLSAYRAEDVLVHLDSASPRTADGLPPGARENWNRFKEKWGLPKALPLTGGFTPEDLPRRRYERESLFIAPWRATRPARR